KSKELSNNSDFLTKKEVYKYLGISTTTMDTVIKDYKVNYEKVSGQMFFTKEQLKSLKEEQKNARKLLDDYYLGSEVRRITNLISVSKGFGEKFERIPCPSILTIPRPADKSGNLWKNADVHTYLNEI